MDFGALNEHILKNIEDLVISMFYESGIFVTDLTTGDKLVIIGDLGCMSKMFISINTSLWWILWH